MAWSILRRYHSGSILVFAVWSLFILTIFALSIGAGVRQKIILASRLEDRDKLYVLLESAVKKTIAVLNNSEDKAGAYTANVKMTRHNNAYRFSEIALNGKKAEVFYVDENQKYFGVMDDERKININKADGTILASLFQLALDCDENEAAQLARAVLDWRETGETELSGFYSDEYYANLEYPYRPKDSDFEFIDELLLVKGFTEERVRRLKDFLTVYGEGKVNINTASKAVLMSLGLEEDLARRILAARRGGDGLEATADDFIFQNTHDIGSSLYNLIEIEPQELAAISMLQQGRITHTSSFFSINAAVRQKNLANSIICIFNAADKKIEYWQEN